MIKPKLIIILATLALTLAVMGTALAARAPDVIVHDLTLTQTQMLEELTETYWGDAVAAQSYFDEFGPGERPTVTSRPPRALDVIARDPFLTPEQAKAEMAETYRRGHGELISRDDVQAAHDYYEMFAADTKAVYALDPVYHPGAQPALGRGACCLTSDDDFYLYLP